MKQIKVNWILVLIGAFMMLWSIGIRLFAGILNIGTEIFFLLGLLILLLGLFYERCREFRKKHKKVVIAIYCLIGLGALAVLIESNLMLAATFNLPQGDTTLIVLGSQVKKEGPSKMTRLRLDKAYEYLVDHPDSVCVLSGGQGATEPWSEAQGMADYLIGKGIDESRLYQEDRSTSTEENIEFSMELIEREGLSKNVTIVTNAFHVYRAGRIARSQGLDFTVLPAKSAYEIFPSYYVRELLAIAADWVF